MIKVFILLTIMMCSVCTENALASSSTQIEKIEVDGKAIKTRYKVFVLSDKWIEARRTRTGFILPKKLSSKEYLSVLITFGKHRLVFSNIHVSKFTVTWVVGIDNKPFSEEFATTEEAETIKRIYYIQFVGTGLETQLVVKVR